MLGAEAHARPVGPRGVACRSTTAPATTTVSGATLRAAAGLRSTWVTALGSLSLTRPGGAAVYGEAAHADGQGAGRQGRGARAARRRRLADSCARLRRANGEAARAGELPPHRRQARRPGAEGAGRAARAPRRGRRSDVRAPCSRSTPGATVELQQLDGRRLVDGRRGDARTRRAPSARRARARGATAPASRRPPASPRGCPGRSRCRDPRRTRRCLAAALLAPSADAARYAVGARLASPTCRALAARARPRRGEPRAAARARRRASRRRRACSTSPARPTSSGSAYAGGSPSCPTDPLAEKQWHLRDRPRLRLLGRAAAAAAGARRRDRLGDRRRRIPSSRARSPTRRASSAAPRASTARATAPSSPG